MPLAHGPREIALLKASDVLIAGHGPKVNAKAALRTIVEIVRKATAGDNAVALPRELAVLDPREEPEPTPHADHARRTTAGLHATKAAHVLQSPKASRTIPSRLSLNCEISSANAPSPGNAALGA
jgi:hypothetical protein